MKACFSPQFLLHLQPTTIGAGIQAALRLHRKMQITIFWFHNDKGNRDSLCVPQRRDGLRETRMRPFPLQSKFYRIDLSTVLSERAASKPLFFSEASENPTSLLRNKGKKIKIKYKTPLFCQDYFCVTSLSLFLCFFCVCS